MIIQILQQPSVTQFLKLLLWLDWDLEGVLH